LRPQRSEPIGNASSALPEADAGRAIGVEVGEDVTDGARGLAAPPPPTGHPSRVTDARSPENRQALTAAAAHRSDTVVLLAGTYALFSLIAAMVQAGKLTQLNLESAPSSTIGWFVWWSLTGVFAVVIGAAATVVSTLLRLGHGRMATNSERVDEVSSGTG
jgi:hypothetical protein